MAILKPFRSIRPNPAFAHNVAALPYDVMNSHEARELVKDNPYSFLHIDKAEIDLPLDVDPYSDIVYQKAKENFQKLLDDGIFIMDEKPCYYIYELTMNGRVQTGLVGCCSVDEYIEGKIKKHEFTREDKENDRIRHVDALSAQTGPIFMAHKHNEQLEAFLLGAKRTKNPVYSFTTDDKITHAAWIIDEPSLIAKIEGLMKEINTLYIADGHHRNASAHKVCLKRRESNPNYDKNAEFNYYLSVLFSSDNLYIMDYNRVVTDLAGLSAEDFLLLLRENFCVKEIGKTPYKPSQKGEIGMYVNGMWYKLYTKPNTISGKVLDDLDVAILQKFILKKHLKINDVRTDKRIDFVGGIRGLSELSNRVDSGEMAVAFAMYPTSIEELMDVADNNDIMPPKSTWFEPKLRSGLFIHKI